MATKKRTNFYESEEGQEVKDILKKMAQDDGYNTGPSYSANIDEYPDNLISFVDKHMQYLNTHPSVNPSHYLSNLRLMKRVRVSQ